MNGVSVNPGIIVLTTTVFTMDKIMLLISHKRVVVLTPLRPVIMLHGEMLLQEISSTIPLMAQMPNVLYLTGCAIRKMVGLLHLHLVIPISLGSMDVRIKLRYHLIQMKIVLY